MKKSKISIYQFAAGRRIIHIKAKNLTSAKNKALAWKNKHAKNTVLAYDFRVN